MKVRRPFADLVQPAQELLDFFRKAGVVCELGGSMRRQAATVGDIDIVVEADSLDSVVLPEWLDYVRSGEKAAHGEMDLDGQILGVDIWCATPNQWGAFLWYITGSKELNVIMRQRLKRRVSSCRSSVCFVTAYKLMTVQRVVLLRLWAWTGLILLIAKSLLHLLAHRLPKMISPLWGVLPTDRGGTPHLFYVTLSI
jgi:hypothetical protein